MNKEEKRHLLRLGIISSVVMVFIGVVKESSRPNVEESSSVIEETDIEETESSEGVIKDSEKIYGCARAAEIPEEQRNLAMYLTLAGFIIPIAISAVHSVHKYNYEIEMSQDRNRKIEDDDAEMQGDDIKMEDDNEENLGI